MGRQHWVYWSSNKRLNSLFGTKANKRFFLVRHEILRWDFEMMQKPTRGIIPCSAYLLMILMKANKRFLPCSAHTHWDEILRPPTRGFFLVRWGFWWFFLPRRRWWWYRVTRNKSAKWFRYDILVCYRSRLENDDHVMTMIWVYGWEIKSMSVDLSTHFTELMTDREGDVRTRTLHQKSVQAQWNDDYTWSVMTMDDEKVYRS